MGHHPIHSYILHPGLGVSGYDRMKGSHVAAPIQRMKVRCGESKKVNFVIFPDDFLTRTSIDQDGGYDYTLLCFRKEPLTVLRDVKYSPEEASHLIFPVYFFFNYSQSFMRIK